MSNSHMWLVATVLDRGDRTLPSSQNVLVGSTELEGVLTMESDRGGSVRLMGGEEKIW